MNRAVCLRRFWRAQDCAASNSARQGRMSLHGSPGTVSPVIPAKYASTSRRCRWRPRYRPLPGDSIHRVVWRDIAQELGRLTEKPRLDVTVKFSYREGELLIVEVAPSEPIGRGRSNRVKVQNA
jgi:hypothetical protein